MTYCDRLGPGPGLAMRAGTTRPGARAYTTTGITLGGRPGGPRAGGVAGPASARRGLSASGPGHGAAPAAQRLPPRIRDTPDS